MFYCVLPCRSDLIKNWQSWCLQQRKRVRVVEADVPDGILPKGFKASLADIKVGLLNSQ